MLVDKYVKIKITKRNKDYYNNLKYNTDNKMITVKTEDVQKESEIIIHVQCDYCGKIIEKTIAKYNHGHKHGCMKDACNECKKYKIKDVNMILYGVDNPMKDKDIQEKFKQSILNKYGVCNVAYLQNTKDKRKQTNLLKYGVENAMQSVEVKQKHHINQMYHNNNCILSSYPQTKYCEMFNGILNYPIGSYWVDILLDNNIILEYDGSGHDLTVRTNKISMEKFLQNEQDRENYFLSKGYKIIRFISKKDIVYDIDTAHTILNYCIELLQRYNIVKYNLDNKQIIMPETTE